MRILFFLLHRIHELELLFVQIYHDAIPTVGVVLLLPPVSAIRHATLEYFLFQQHLFLLIVQVDVVPLRDLQVIERVLEHRLLRYTMAMAKLHLEFLFPSGVILLRDNLLLWDPVIVDCLCQAGVLLLQDGYLPSWQRIVEEELLCWPKSTLPLESKFTDSFALLDIVITLTLFMYTVADGTENGVVFLPFEHHFPGILFPVGLIDYPLKSLTIQVMDRAIFVCLFDFFSEVFKDHILQQVVTYDNFCFDLRRLLMRQQYVWAFESSG